MANDDPFQLEQQKRLAEKRKAQDLFDLYKTKKLSLKRPVFFVPGWTDEWCGCWQPLRGVLKQILLTQRICFLLILFWNQ